MQGVLVFASEAARNAAITSPQEGQFAYTKDNNSLWYYTGSAWAASGATGDIEGVTVTSPLTGGGTSGTVTVGILSGTTSNLGAVQLSDSTSSTSTTLAATANAVKTTYDRANAAKFGQIVQADYTGQTTITSTSFVTTNLAASITPSATTSKVLVQVTIPFYGPGGGQQMDLAIYRGTVGSGTNLSPSNSLLWGTRAELQSGAMLFLDSPATASAQIYTVAAKVAGGTGYTINSPSRGVITLTEVLA
jgi:hypothetical protein